MVAEQTDLLDAVLTRAAEQVGDITASAMAHFYARYPAALASFDLHAAGNRPRLEGLMVENALYCLMYWQSEQASIEFLLSSSVPHHHDTLKVPAEWYSGLMESVVAILAQLAISAQERAVLDDLLSKIGAYIETTRSHFHAAPH